MLLRRKESSDRIAPVRELFGHIADTRQFYAVMVASGRMHDVFELSEGHFGRAIDQRLAGLPRARAITSEHRAAVAHALAGSLLSLLSWWIHHGMRESPARMDDLYHRMVWTASAPRSVWVPPLNTARSVLSDPRSTTLPVPRSVSMPSKPELCPRYVAEIQSTRFRLPLAANRYRHAVGGHRAASRLTTYGDQRIGT